MSRTNKQPYQKSRRFDVTCRNHGSCNWCEDDRLHSRRRDLLIADEKVTESKYYAINKTYVFDLF